jgi:hypothetical protein
MKSFITMALLAVTLLSAGSAFGAQVSIGIRIGPPPPPRVVRVFPARPAPEFIWVEGYWYPVGSGHHWKWHDGYWTRAPYVGARWYAPRYEEGLYFEGYWVGDRGRYEHDHHWDRDRDRDYREHERGHGRGHDRDHDDDNRQR